MFLKTEAVVLKTNRGVNNDVFVTLFTKRAGKIEAVATGAKSSKSQLAACSKPFVAGEFVLSTKSKVMKIISCDIQASNYRIVDHLDTLAYGNYFLELCQLSTHTHVVDTDHYDLIVKIFAELAAQVVEPKLLRAVYLVKLTQITGHTPNLVPRCTLCQNDSPALFLDVHAGVLVCKGCLKTSGKTIKMQRNTIELLSYIINKDIDLILRTKIHPNYLTSIINAFEIFISFHIGIKELKTRPFLEDILL